MIEDYPIHTYTHFSSGPLPGWIVIVALVNFRRNITSGPTMYSKLVIHAQFKFIYTRAFRQSTSVRTLDLWPIRTCAAVRPIASRRSVSSPDGKSTHFDDERRRARPSRWSRGGEGELVGVHDPPVTETFETCRPELSDRGIYFDRYTSDTLGPHRGKSPVINLLRRTRGPSRFQKDLLISCPTRVEHGNPFIGYAQSWHVGYPSAR